MELGCRDGKEVVVVGVTSGRALAGAREGRERGDPSSWHGSEGDEPREESSVGTGRDLCGDREGSGVGRGRVRSQWGDRKGSGVRMGKSPLWGW